MQHFFDDQIDIDWVFKVNLKAYDGTALHLSTKCIIIEGSEDSPDKVELFSVNHYMATPVVFIRSEDTGDLVKRSNNMKFTVDEYRISSHYLSSLINGDSSGLEDEEAVDFNDWVKLMQDDRVGHWDCDSESYIAMCEVTGLLSDCTNVRFIYRVDSGDNV